MPVKSAAKVGYNSNYSTGIRAENKVASTYRASGWLVNQSAGSRGAADLKCTRGDTTHYVQVKSSTSGSPYISNHEIGRLKSTATRNNATAVIAKVTSNTTSIQYAKTASVVKM